MKDKYRLLKILLILLAFVIAGIIYSCISSGNSTEIAVSVDSVSESEEGPEKEVPSADQGSSAEDDTDLICVHVCGAVTDPGVYYLKEGSRIHEAVDMAGGFSPQADPGFVNLAGIVSDGEQIYIPTRYETETMDHPGISDRSSPERDGLININTAGINELTTLAGIGQSRAQAIITYRENVSEFESVEDILKVSGIGNSIYEKIKDSIKV